jgi:hypothetical protein
MGIRPVPNISDPQLTSPHNSCCGFIERIRNLLGMKKEDTEKTKKTSAQKEYAILFFVTGPTPCLMGFFPVPKFFKDFLGLAGSC